MFPILRKHLIKNLRVHNHFSKRFFAGSLVNENGFIKFPLTDIGEGIKEVELIHWFVESGSQIQEFDKLCEVMSDKANVEITSPLDGEIYELHWKVGEMAQVGQPLMTIKVASTGASEPSQAATSTPEAEYSPSIPTEIARGPLGLKIQTTPAVRKIAKENNIDLSLITGTGPSARILKEDLLVYLKNQTQQSASASSTSGVTAQIRSTPTPFTSQPAAPSTPKPAIIRTPPPTPAKEDTIVPIMGIQKFMVKKMEEANAVPQFGFGDEYCMDRLISIRSDLKKPAEKMGIKLSYLPFILKAVSLSLLEYPLLNSHVNSNCTEVIYKGSHNLGVAIDSPQGLVVPNIKDCQNKSIFEIAQDLDELVIRVKEKRTSQSDVTGGTFTLSNIGALGGTVCRPIVFVPETCIGALGKTQKIATFDANNQVVPKHMMHVAWSADHRVIDGATVARFQRI